MSSEDLELQDANDNTAFSLAAATGNMQIVEIMKRKNQSLPFIRGAHGTTPLHVAALQGRSEMAWHLYHETIRIFEYRDWTLLLFYCVYSGIYGNNIARTKHETVKDGESEL
ncbi:uncharacterized protein LOC114758480 [Neltuma alba]|uniref:uncharacterized protein LOC114758480 n=1 Tax=Neltuma alba TaxID=207710 RepID=UPI0010A58ECF|nr:uncharacterized protein LOC114758480 [Prosopis alba]